MAERSPERPRENLPMAMNGRLVRFIDSYVGIPLIRLISIITSNRRKRTLAPLRTSPGRILLVKFWGIGNLFMLLPTINALRATFSDSVVDFLTLHHNRDALTMTGAIDDVFTIDIRKPYRFLATWSRVATQLRRRHYDLVIDFEQFARFSALISHQVGATRSIGYETKGQRRHHLYTDPVHYNNDIHITRSFYSLTERAGIRHPFSPRAHLAALEAIETRGKDILNNLGVSPAQPVVIMHVGTSENFRERRWAPPRYAKLANLLREKYGFFVVLTGLSNEAHLTREARENIRAVDKMRDLGGQLSFDDYFALIAASDLVISADTAAVHLASAINIPVVGLYGPNTPLLYGPWGQNGLAVSARLECSPCITNFNSKINTCRHPDGKGACMNAISVDDVFMSIEKMYCAPEAPFRLAKFTGTVPESCIA